MPTEKPRVTFTISKEKLEELERFQHENRIKNQTQAVLALIEKGLSGYEAGIKNSPSTAMAEPGEEIIRLFDYINQALVLMGLIGEKDDITEDQAEILIAVCRILHTSFKKR